MLNENDSDFFSTRPTIYRTNCSLTNKIFRNRLETAISFAHVQNNSVLLDVGCNDAELFQIIRKKNKSCKCIGIDIWPKIKALEIENCKFQIADVRKLPFDDTFFDIVFALDTLEHVENIEIGIKEIYRVLKPNGIAILSGPTESWFYRFCRILLYKVFDRKVMKKNFKPSGKVDYHLYTIYEIEKKFIKRGFKKIDQKSLPQFPFPPLFRVTKFKK